ncbi:hypothetical protein M404DRAFT_552561 [Pisolithus tinctorius Marx 270]|uniref:Uncharacterized protein n=1 Tax=Pisolithus tinctorius Marx 270 TaxID=870435 RepID=A0A0C3P9I5_PISTI|nr:hypothetical protein M404DRAFT_552561 [Pisolithus tinctorius Marx 270]
MASGLERTEHDSSRFVGGKRVVVYRCAGRRPGELSIHQTCAMVLKMHCSVGISLMHVESTRGWKGMKH